VESPVTQAALTDLSAKMNKIYEGLTSSQVEEKGLKSSTLEQVLTENLVKIMKAEDQQEYDQSYLEGLHFMLNQPEFSHNQKILAIMELLEHRAMLGTILPQEKDNRQVQVVIGTENKSEVAQDCSLVVSRYGLPNEASGTIMVVGPTRMAYPRVISAVSYLSFLLSGMVAELYGVNVFPKPNKENTN
jgi:heat-inducible transcriptional repressor